MVAELARRVVVPSQLRTAEAGDGEDARRLQHLILIADDPVRIISNGCHQFTSDTFMFSRAKYACQIFTRPRDMPKVIVALSFQCSVCWLNKFTRWLSIIGHIVVQCHF